MKRELFGAPFFCLNTHMTFWEFFFENRKGEKNHNPTNLFKGHGQTYQRGTTQGDNLTYQKDYLPSSKEERKMLDLRSGKTSSQPVDHNMIKHLQKLGIVLPTKVGESKHVGRSGSLKQAQITLTPTGYVLRGV